MEASVADKPVFKFSPEGSFALSIRDTMYFHEFISMADKPMIIEKCCFEPSEALR